MTRLAFRRRFPGRALPPETRAFLAAALGLALLVAAIPAAAQCPADTTIQNYAGLGGTPCPCFVSGEEAGSVLLAPSEHYPLQVTKVGIFWASAFGGAPNTLEQSVRIYNAGLPNPGIHIFELPGPVLTDGVINEYDIEAFNVMIESGPITATLEFLNQNSGNQFAPSVAYDNTCTGGRNVVKAIPGGWADACLLGVPGDWIFTVTYKPCQLPTGIGDDETFTIASSPAFLLPAAPNPVRGATELEFFLADPGAASIQVFDAAGRRVATLAEGSYGEGSHRVSWRPASELVSGIYFVKLTAAGTSSVQKVMLAD